jgi:hypothetical protein
MDEGDIPREVPASEDYAGETENVLRGHKASMANPSMAAPVYFLIEILQRPMAHFADMLD